MPEREGEHVPMFKVSLRFYQYLNISAGLPMMNSVFVCSLLMYKKTEAHSQWNMNIHKKKSERKEQTEAMCIMGSSRPMSMF